MADMRPLAAVMVEQMRLPLPAAWRFATLVPSQPSTNRPSAAAACRYAEGRFSQKSKLDSGGMAGIQHGVQRFVGGA